MLNKRKKIRELIEIKTNRICQDNFTILEEKDNKVKVEVHWTSDNQETLIINLKNNAKGNL